MRLKILGLRGQGLGHSPQGLKFLAACQINDLPFNSTAIVRTKKPLETKRCAFKFCTKISFVKKFPADAFKNRVLAKKKQNCFNKIDFFLWRQVGVFDDHLLCTCGDSHAAVTGGLYLNTV